MRKAKRMLALAAMLTLSLIAAKADAQQEATATWTLSDGTASEMNATMSAEGLASVATMTVGSGLSVVEPQNIDGLSFFKVQPTVQASANDDANALTFTITPKRGLTYTPTRLTMKAARFGTDGGTLSIVAAVGQTTLTLAESTTPNRNNSKTTAHYSDYSFDISGLQTEGEPMTVKVYIKNLSTSKQYGLRDVALTGTFAGDAEEVKTCRLSLSTDTPEAGTITVSPAGTEFDEGTEITISTTENFSYHFMRWEDGEGNTLSELNPYTFAISQDMTVKAVYDKATVYSLDLTLTNGARRNLVGVEPEGNVVGSIHQYEAGTQVKLTAQNNKVLTFTGWEDNTTNAVRELTMDADKAATANYSAADYIVGWDLYDVNPRNERAADYKSDTENAGLLSLRDSVGNTSSWLSLGEGSTLENGKYAARVWRPLAQRYYFEISFSTRGFKNVVVSNDLGNAYNSYSTYLEQASTDGSNYTTVGRFEMPSGGWAGVKDIQLPDSFAGRDKVWVRWMPDYASPLVGTTNDNDGLAIAEIFVLADTDEADDDVAPTLLSSNPADGATGASATGSIVLNFDEKVRQGTGSATLGDETLQPIVSGKTVVYRYSSLNYNTRYTFHLPAGAITDRRGNGCAEATISFTTMQRAQPTPRLYDAVVAADSTGDYLTLQEAIDAAPEGRTQPWLIFVKKGRYNGHVDIPAQKPYIHIIGQDRDLVQLADGRISGSTGQYDLDGATVYISSDNVFIEGVDIINSHGVEAQDGPQSHALCSLGDKLVMNRAKVRSYQDSWFTGKATAHRAFVKNSWIEGAVDFIFGQGDIMMLADTINIMRKQGGYIVAPNHAAGTRWGYVFLNSVITAPGVAQETSVWLGRPWHNAPKTVYINTRAETTIPATGWYDHMGGLPALWAEFNTMDADGNPVDLSHRRTDYYYVDSATGDTIRGSSQKAVLTAEEAAEYTVKNVCGGDDAWNPELLCEPCDAPNATATGKLVSWDSVPYAICYVVSRGTDVVGFTTSTEFEATADGDYTIQAANEFGGLSPATHVGVATGIATATTGVRRPAIAAIHTIDGKRMRHLTRGINIVSYADGTVRKVVR